MQNIPIVHFSQFPKQGARNSITFGGPLPRSTVLPHTGAPRHIWPLALSVTTPIMSTNFALTLSGPMLRNQYHSISYLWQHRNKASTFFEEVVKEWIKPLSSGVLTIHKKGELCPTQFSTGQIGERSSHEHNSHKAGADDVNTRLEVAWVTGLSCI